MRGSTFFFGVIAILALMYGLIRIHAWHIEHASLPTLKANIRMASELELTDLCVFSEASYTRHPTQTDLATPFQDSPATFEHFPSGMLTATVPRSSGGTSTLTITRHHDHH